MTSTLSFGGKPPRGDVAWAGVDGRSLEHLRLQLVPSEVEGGQVVMFEADGAIVGVADGRPFRLRYVIRCDEGWRVREVELESLWASDPRSRQAIRIPRLRADGDGNWQGAPTTLQGCIDVDISVTPFTNTLPIRRLALQPGQSAEIRVAYFDAPTPEVRQAQQRYTCLVKDGDRARYRYESLDSGFTAELEVDAEGLVIDYPGVWRRVWPR